MDKNRLIRRIVRPVPRVHAAARLFLVVSVAAVLASTRAAASETLFTPRHVAKLKRVVSAVISPNGRQVAYTLSVPRMPIHDENGPAWVELHVVDASGKSRPFVTGKVKVAGVRWIPDGSGIAYLAKRGEDKHTSIYVVPINGGESRKLTDHDADIRSIAFNSRDKRLAFLATEPISKDRQEFRDKGFDQQIYEEDWRPTKVWIAQRDGGGEPRALDLPGSASSVVWSPGGRELAVVLAPTPLVDDGYMSKRVYVVDSETGRIVERIQNPGKLGQVAWSPDGKFLAMISAVDINDPSEGHLMVAQIPGGGPLRDLMPDYRAHVTSFAWQDDDTLVWVADEFQDTTIGRVNVDGQKRMVSDSHQAVFSGLTASSDGNTVSLVGHHAHYPHEVFRLASDQETPQKLTNSNAWLTEMRFADQEVVSWKARDGMELEGILMYPLNYQSGRRYPLIMLVHGGPEAHVANGWVTSYSNPGQVAAARGFAVFYPNYRGSTGRGVEFSKLGQADAAGKEFDDLVDGVDHLIATGLVDKDKVGITGGSYGGYASAWGATYYSDRYAASVMFVGISDNVSKVGTTDIPEEMYLVHHRKRLWDDWQYFLERSPIRHVQKNRTPTLILHGDSDPRVHPSQSMELHRHLKTLKQAPVRLVFYKGEGHGNRKAAARLDYNVRMLRWMEHYLQGDGGDPPHYDIDYAEVLDQN